MSTTHPISTAEQLLSATGLGRCELLRGELIMMSPAGFEHGMIVANITGTLRDYVRKNPIGYIAGAETGFQIEQNPDTVRAPDVAFIHKDRVPDDPVTGFFPGPPDLAVEVLSPNDRAGEVSAKIESWLAAGCRAVWVVDPDATTVTRYHSDTTPDVLDVTQQLTDENLLPGCCLPVAEIFAR